MSALYVFIGSGIGGVLRWLISSHLNTSHPWGTMLVNILGCLLIGLLSRHVPADSQAKLLLVAGFCGGFTTFSTFINENLLMLQGTQLAASLLYIAASLVLGLLAAWLGYNI